MASASNFGKLQPLPADLQATISSAVHITSLNDVVLQLVRNAVDAAARSVAISVDYAKGFCSVIDDGSGIPEREFRHDGNIARLYCTSKLGSIGVTYGCHGRFLACLSAISLLEISSRTGEDDSTSSVLLNMGDIVAKNVYKEEELRAGSGTKVVVRNLFGSLPVRLKERALRYSEDLQMDKDFQSLKLMLTALIVAYHGRLELKVQDAFNRTYKHSPRVRAPPHSDRSMNSFNVAHIASTFFQARLTPTSSTSRWKTASARTASMNIRIAIHLDPASRKAAQFISVGMEPLDRQGIASELWSLTNDKFDKSTFGGTNIARDELKSPKLYRQESRGSKGTDKWPTFYVRIDLAAEDEAQSLSGTKDPSTEAQSCLNSILQLLALVVDHWLVTNMYTAKKVPSTESARASDLEPRARQQNSRYHARAEQQDQHVKPSGFEMWSRVKYSAQNRPFDVLSGLPFLDRSRAQVNKPLQSLDRIPDEDNSAFLRPQTTGEEALLCPNSCEEDETVKEAGSAVSSNAFTPGDEQVYWKNPRSGVVVPIDARTGFTISRSKDRRPATAPVLSSNRHEGGLREAEQIKSAPRPTSAAPKMQKLSRRVLDFCSSIAGSAISKLDVHEDDVCGVQSQHADRLFSAASNADQKITKSMLKRARVLRQVDGKFILTAMHCQSPSGDRAQELLALVDQHAADERIKLEALFQGICSSNLMTHITPILLEIPSDEELVFRSKQAYFQQWGIVYEVLDRQKHSSRIAMNTTDQRNGRALTDQVIVQINALPDIIAERCRLEPRLLINLLRKEVCSEIRQRSFMHDKIGDEDVVDWITKLRSCPLGLIDMLISRSCRSAAMFNDRLTIGQCEVMLRNLSACAFPFMCAHGRPSMIVLANVQADDAQDPDLLGDTSGCKHGNEDFGVAWAAWS